MESLHFCKQHRLAEIYVIILEIKQFDVAKKYRWCKNTDSYIYLAICTAFFLYTTVIVSAHIQLLPL